jgi:2-polyprenyl-3-methyl-5-hydroxy-6-metoxy-1,4-benzoquinol methylase
MKFLIYSKRLTSGLAVDADVLKDVLSEHKVDEDDVDVADQVTLKQFYDVDYQVVFILQNISPDLFRSIKSQYYVFVPNVEFVEEWDVTFMPFIDYVMCKNKQVYNYFKEFTPVDKLVMTYFTSPVVNFNVNRKRNNKLVFHPAGTSFLKGTLEILKAFTESRELENLELYITRKQEYGQRSKDITYWKGLKPKKETVEINGDRVQCWRYKNIYMFDRLSESAYRYVMETAGIQLSPSVAEGFSHAVNQGRQAGIVTVVNDCAPLNTLITNEKLLVKTSRILTTKQFMPWKKYLRSHMFCIPSVVGITNRILGVRKMSQKELGEIQDENIRNFNKQDKQFRKLFGELLAVVTVMKTKEDIFNKIYKDNVWNATNKDDVGEEISLSGPGSSIKAATHDMQIISNVIEKYSIKSVLDIGCGDVKWMSKLLEMHPSVKYHGVDVSSYIIEKNRKKYPTYKFTLMDASTEVELPKAELCITREVLQHLSLDSVKIIIDNIKKSDCKYFMSTNYETKKNINIMAGQTNYQNLMISPFNLPEPKDTYTTYFSKHANGRVQLCLWEVEKLREEGEAEGRVTGGNDNNSFFTSSCIGIAILIMLMLIGTLVDRRDWDIIPISMLFITGCYLIMRY